MTWIATLYKEGGVYDGETFVCGPFEQYEDAQKHATELSDHGSADTLPLASSASEIIATL